MAETENKAASVVNVAFAVAGAAVAVYIVFRIAVAIFGSTSTTTNKKTMKAPGKNVRIFRGDFAGDPKSYFRKLRNK
ncbi:hypothetical protein FCV25MIE_15415 [Fagus crenata]|jgi:hypothetical protein